MLMSLITSAGAERIIRPSYTARSQNTKKEGRTEFEVAGQCGVHSFARPLVRSSGGLAFPLIYPSHWPIMRAFTYQSVFTRIWAGETSKIIR